MKSLIGIRSNLYYTKDEKGVETKHHELILLLDTPTYSRSNTGEVIRERAIEEARFTTTDKGLDALLETLGAMKEATEADLN
jgi:hypothetical protein